MAKKLGNKSKKKGLDGRDFASIAGYLLFFGVILVLYVQASSGNKEVGELEKEERSVNKRLIEIIEQSKKSEKQKKKVKVDLDLSEQMLKKQEQQFKIVTGTSLEYAKKNKLMMAVWEAIDKVRNVALRYISVKENQVKLELYTPQDIFLTEFMSELNKRKDLILSIQISKTELEKMGDKKDKETLVGYFNIQAKRPMTKSDRQVGQPVDNPNQINASDQPTTRTSRIKK